MVSIFGRGNKNEEDEIERSRREAEKQIAFFERMDIKEEREMKRMEKKFASLFKTEKAEPKTKREKQLARGREILKQQRAARLQAAKEVGYGIGKRIGEFQPVEQDFSQHEQTLRELFGRGEHVWGTEMQPVKIYNDLNPRQRGFPGDDETAKMFGFG